MKSIFKSVYDLLAGITELAIITVVVVLIARLVYELASFVWNFNF